MSDDCYDKMAPLDEIRVMGISPYGRTQWWSHERDMYMTRALFAEAELLKARARLEQLEDLLQGAGVVSVWVPQRGMLTLELGADLGNGDGFRRLAPALRERANAALLAALTEAIDGPSVLAAVDPQASDPGKPTPRDGNS